MASWGVVATVKEPPELLAAFAAHYLHQGASELHLYLDGVDPKIEALFERLPKCHLIVADEEFYQSEFGFSRPGFIRRRQRLNATHAYARRAQVDWLLHVDADEYLQSQDFAGELDAVAPHIDAIQIPNGERIFRQGEPLEDVFDGWMLAPHSLDRRAARDVFDDTVRHFSDKGFLGHRWGKSATRVGRSLKLGIHAPRERKTCHLAKAETAQLCHFDGVTELHWALKLLRHRDGGLYVAEDHHARFRRAQISFVTEADAPVRALELHRALRVYDVPAFERLLAHGIAAPIKCDPMAGVSRFFQRGMLDLSPDAFDRYLAQSMPDQFALLSSAAA